MSSYRYTFFAIIFSFSCACPVNANTFGTQYQLYEQAVLLGQSSTFTDKYDLRTSVSDVTNLETEMTKRLMAKRGSQGFEHLRLDESRGSVSRGAYQGIGGQGSDHQGTGGHGSKETIGGDIVESPVKSSKNCENALYFSSLVKQDVEKLSLNQAIRLGLENSYRLKIGDRRLSISEQAIRQEQGSFDPRVSLGYSQNIYNNIDPFSGRPLEYDTEVWQTSNALSGTLSSGTRYEMGVSYQDQVTESNFISNRLMSKFEISHPLLNGLINNTAKHNLDVAKIKNQLQHHLYREQTIQVLLTIARAYTDVYFAQRNYEAALLSQSLANKLVLDNRVRAQVGRAARSDTVASEARLARTEERVIGARELLGMTQNNLIQILGGKNILRGTHFLACELPKGEPISTNLLADKKMAFRGRTDYQLSKLDLALRQLIVDRDRQLALPDISLTLKYTGYGNSQSSHFSSAYDSINELDKYDVYAGIEFSRPLSNRSARARKSISSHEYHIAKIEKQELLNKIEISLRNAHLRLNAIWGRLEKNRKALELAELSLSNEEERLRSGKSNSFFVLNLQDQLESVRIRSIITETDYFKAILNYHYEKGTLLSYFDIDQDHSIIF